MAQENGLDYGRSANRRQAVEFILASRQRLHDFDGLGYTCAAIKPSINLRGAQ